PFSCTWSAQMVRPFLRWMISAGAALASDRDRHKKVTKARTRAHSSNRVKGNLVTKVISKVRCAWPVAACLLLAAAGFCQAPSPKPAEDLYLQLRSVGLDPSRVYRARDVSIDRASIHITLEDGTLAFTKDVAGRVTGAFFEGEGEILLAPPNQLERSSMALFTGAAILEERFFSGYFRFNDDTFTELKPALRPAENADVFVSEWNETAQNLASID